MLFVYGKSPWTGCLLKTGSAIGVVSDVGCIQCNQGVEDRDRLFASCSFIQEVYQYVALVVQLAWHPKEVYVVSWVICARGRRIVMLVLFLYCGLRCCTRSGSKGMLIFLEGKFWVLVELLRTLFSMLLLDLRIVGKIISLVRCNGFPLVFGAFLASFF